MAREEMQLEAGRFTTANALAKEVTMLIVAEDIELFVVANQGTEGSLDMLQNELSGRDGIELVRVTPNTLMFRRKEPLCPSPLPSS